MGRPSETVQKDITPQGADLVTGVMYDAYGRDSLHWLPAVISGNNGNFTNNYPTQASNSNGNDANPYSRTDYEPSPLNRVTGQYGPGTDWYSNGKKVTTAYLTNGPSDVKLFTVTGNTLTGGGYYAAATLYGLQTTDEDGKTVEVFTDKQGRKVLSRVDGSANTYYVYDDLNNLRYVLPPTAADSLGGSGNYSYAESNGVLGRFGYIYHYDGRNRCIMKKLPGCDSICMVYDIADRLVASQDGNQRQKGEWTVNRYDKFNRLLYSFIATNTQSVINSVLKGNTVSEVWNGNASTGGYTIMGSTTSSLTIRTLLTVNYYDTYAHLKLLDGTTKGQLGPVNQSDYTFPDTLHVKTLLTGTRVYHLDNPTKYEVTSIYYDKYGHVVQTRATNHLGGYDITCSFVDFTGKPTNTYITHSINGTTVSLTEAYAYAYDKAQRLTVTKYGINVTTPTLILSTNTYDELGRVLTKTVGGTLDATTYAYNVRSWLTSITGSRFTENLYYENNPANLSTFTACYNGNIAGMQWSVPAESLGYNRSYIFGYDGLNRLSYADYSGWNGTTAVTGTTGLYNEQMSYDKQGNFVSLDRWDQAGELNQLTFTSYGNQLKKVDDGLHVPLPYGSEAFPDKATKPTEYAYDRNGNITYDGNTGISTIRYNVLNLPDTIQFVAGHQNYYTYDASGKKLEVQNITSRNILNLPQDTITRLTSSTKLTTDYCGNVIYQNGSLKEILTPEGYWKNGVFYYYLKDYQGNTRVVLSQSGTVVEYSDYYPDGMRFQASTSDTTALPYRYNGKELETMNGLNEYDYGARRRETGIPVWTTVDLLCEGFYSINPYSYVFDNPIKFIDPFGLDTCIYNPKDKTYQSVEHPQMKELTVIAKKKGNNISSSNGHSWLFPIIGDLDGNKELDSGINPFIPTPHELNKDADFELIAGISLLSGGLIEPVIETLQAIKYSQLVLKLTIGIVNIGQRTAIQAALFSMEYPLTDYMIYVSGSTMVGIGGGIIQGYFLPLSPEIPTINSIGINPWLDNGTIIGSYMYNLINYYQYHK